MLTLQRQNTEISFKNLDTELQSINENDTEQTVMQKILNKNKKKSANSNHAKDEIDKHFQDFLKFRKHDDYIEYKLSYMEAKAYFKSMDSEKSLINIADNIKKVGNRVQANSKLSNSALNPSSFKLPTKGQQNPLMSKRNSMVKFITKPNTIELSSLDKNYYNWKSLKNHFVDVYKRSMGSITDGKTTTNKTLEFPTFGGSMREGTETSFSRIKLIDKSKRKSTINSLRRTSKIFAIKNNGLAGTTETNSFQNISFLEINFPDEVADLNAEINSKDTISLQNKNELFLPKIVDNKVSFNNDNNNNILVLKLEDAYDNRTVDNEIVEDNDDKTSKSSFCLVSHIPVFEQDEFKNSIDDVRLVNEDEVFKDDRKSTSKSLLSSRYERTKEWIESHEYFFDNIHTE